MFESVLVANRGEIARRILRTAQRMGLRGVAVYSAADADLPFVREADEAVQIGPAAPAESYLNVDAVLEAAQQTGAQAVHPGYGFLAENATFARRVGEAGLRWVGPPPEAIEALGDKVNARNLLADAGIPVAPGSRYPMTDADEAVRVAGTLGYPLMVKAVAGGGGIGMSVASDEMALRTAFATASSRAERFFGNPGVLLERYLPGARHVEVQILGLPDGRILTLGERECSVQRRHQKLAEETPSPGVEPALRRRMAAAAARAGDVVGYRNAGTVECLVDQAAQDFVFLEINTRLQVEHPITELVTGVDLVEQQLRIAGGERVQLGTIRPRGHALELRIYAEDPQRFLPAPGRIETWQEPTGPGVRVDAGYAAGTTVTPYYDPLLAKLCLWGADRAQALARARAAVADFAIGGRLKTNLGFFAELLADPDFVSGSYDTGLVTRLRP